jgi:hypothetical protein
MFEMKGKCVKVPALITSLKHVCIRNVSIVVEALMDPAPPGENEFL